MQVISVPFSLRAARTVFWLVAPLAAAQTLIASRAPWWRLPYQSMAFWAVAALMVMGPLGFGMSRGRKWAWKASVAISVLWILVSAWMAVRMRHPTLGYFTIFLAVFFICTLLWLRHEMSRSFLDPEMEWFHGLPKPLPGVECEVVAGDPANGGAKATYRVSRIDREGAFVFSAFAAESPAVRRAIEVAAASAAGARPELIFRFRTHELRCRARPMLMLQRGVGAGFCFEGLTPDTRKSLGDFVEMLRGEGYVG